MSLFGPPDILRLQAQRDIKGLIKALGYTANYDVRQQATEALVQIGETAVDPLIAALKDLRVVPNIPLSVSVFAARALGQIGDARAVDPLVAALKERSLHTCLTSISALGQIGDARAVEPLIELIKNRNDTNIPGMTPGMIIKEVGKALEKMGWKPDKSEAAAAYWIAKGEWGNCVKIGIIAVQPLIDFFMSNSRGDLGPIQALGKIGDPSAVDFLIGNLKYSHISAALLRRDSVDALGIIGDPRAIEPLRAALNDSHPQVREKAYDALKKIESKDKVQVKTVALMELNDTGVTKSPRKNKQPNLIVKQNRRFKEAPMSQIDQATAKFTLLNNSLLEHGGEKAIMEKPKSRLGVTKAINALAVSDDGSLIVSANNAGAISVWDRAQGKLYKQVRASIYTECVSITPDKRTLWVGGCSFDKSGDDGLIELLDLDTGKQISVIDSHNRPVKHIAFSRDGRLAASTGVSWKVIAWDLSSGEALLVGQHPDSGERVIFTPDNSRLVSIGGDWTMKIWDLKTRSCTATWEGEPGYYGVALSADGKWATVGNNDEGRKMIDATNGKTVASWDFTGYKTALYVSPQNSQVVWEGSNNLLKAWHVQTKQHFIVLEKHVAEISAVAISLDGTCVLSGAEDGTIGIWNAG